MDRGVDWKKLEIEYASTEISYAKMAKKYGIPPRVIAYHAKNKKWVEKRKKYKDKLATKAVNMAAEADAKKLAKVITSADKMADVIEKVFQDTEQFHRHIVQTRDGDQWDAEERVFEKIDTKAIRDMTASLKDLTSVLRSLHNLPTVQELESMQLARERLELDKQRAALDRGGDSNIETGVILIEPVAEDTDDEPGAE